MKKSFAIILLIPFWTACQWGDPSEFGIKPELKTYNDEGPVLKKSYCTTTACNNPGNEDRYTYDPDGQLIKIESFARTASGSMEIFSYTDYFFNAAGLPTRKIQYGKRANTPGWAPYYEYIYEYEKGVLATEKTFSIELEPDQKTLKSSTTYEFVSGKLAGQRWFDDKNNFLRRVRYDYQGSTIIRETWYNGEDIATRIFRHTFADNRRQIAEYVPGSKEQIALIEKTYNADGFITGQETKVFNRFICAMMPGVVRYSY